MTKLALLGGTPLGVPREPRHPRLDPAAVREAARLLRAGATVGLGKLHPVIRRAEDAIANYHGGRRVMVTSSGHAALHVALMGLEIGPGDEVITTPYTWGASVSCILHAGAIPVFADVDPVTGLLDPATIDAAATRRTKAVLAVHIFGQPADMPAIRRVARRRGLAVIEDGSQAHGARIGGVVVGNFSDAAGFSCMGGKLLATAEAGYLVTPRADVYWKAAMTCQHYGRAGDPGFPDALRPYVDSLVYTYRLSPVIASLFPSQLRKLDREVRARRRNVDLLRRLLRGNPAVALPDYPRGVHPSYHMLTLNARTEMTGVPRGVLLEALNADGLSAFPYVAEPIYRWKRLQWRGYRGPVPMWLDGLRRAKTDYASLRLPGCEHKIAHGLELGWNWSRYDPPAMRRIAAVFGKVADQLGPLRDLARRRGAAAAPAASATARRVAAGYAKKR